jgi:hypothetical protein
MWSTGEERRIQDFAGETQGNEHLEDLGTYGRAILEWILKKEVGGFRLD